MRDYSQLGSPWCSPVILLFSFICSSIKQILMEAYYVSSTVLNARDIEWIRDNPLSVWILYLTEEKQPKSKHIYSVWVGGLYYREIGLLWIFITLFKQPHKPSSLAFNCNNLLPYWENCCLSPPPLHILAFIISPPHSYPITFWFFLHDWTLHLCSVPFSGTLFHQLCPPICSPSFLS